MAYLIVDDLKTHIASNTLLDIIRNDATIVDEQILVGIAEAKGYCSRFDLAKLFDDAADGFVEDPNLLSKVKDIVCWHVITLSSKSIRLELFSKRYDDAVSWFKSVQSGKVDPGWPVKTNDDDTDRNEGSEVQLYSNTRLNHRY
jgi:hypothetical protein